MMMFIKSLVKNMDGTREVDSFRLIPTDINCPYNEAIYDPEQKILCIVSKDKKQAYHMLPVMDNDGDVKMLRTARKNGKPFPEERRLLDTYYEYYLIDPNDIRTFVKTMTGSSSSAEPYLTVKP